MSRLLKPDTDPANAYKQMTDPDAVIYCNDMRQIGPALQAVRERKARSLADCALQMSVSVPTLTSLEYGSLSATIWLVQRYADLLGANVSWQMGGKP